MLTSSLSKIQLNRKSNCPSPPPSCSERTHALRDTATAVLKEEIAELR